MRLWLPRRPRPRMPCARAAAAMSRIAEPVYPNPAYREIYNRKYALYCKTIDALDPLWDDMQALIETGASAQP